MTATNTRTAPANDTAAAVPPDGPDTATATTGSPRPDGTAGAVWDALTANPGATTMTIATAAHVSRATAAKALTAMEAAGRAVRTPGTGTGRNKTGDTWAASDDAPARADTDVDTQDAAAAPDADSAIADTPGIVTGTAPADAATIADTTPPATSATNETTRADDPDTMTGTAGADAGDAQTIPAGPGDWIQDATRILEAEAERRAQAEAELRQAQAEEEARRAKIDADLHKAGTTEATRQALADLLAAVTTTYTAVISGDTDAMTAGLEKIYTETAAVRRAAKPAAHRATAATVTARGDRTAPRPLRPLIEAHLAAYPGKEFTPGEIAKVLERSPGAVANALDTMVNHGVAELTCEHPRRYRATPTAAVPDTAAPADASPATGDADEAA